MQRLDRFFRILKSPIFWGLLASAGFYAAIFTGVIDVPFIHRYFTHHPVEYGETVLFAIGMAALVLKIIEIAGQYGGLRQSPLGPALRGVEAIDQRCRMLLERVAQLPRRHRGGYYVRRLQAALQWIDRRGSADGLDDELKYMADVDLGRQQTSYGLFRVIIWAIPILGFLGTVVGITMALNGLDPKALDDSMLRLAEGLGLKFDTTALALSMSMLLMFIHFFVDRAEAALLERVDEQVEDDLGNHFRRLPTGPDGQLAAMREMTAAVMQLTQQLAQHQTELWQEAAQGVAEQWSGLAEAVGTRVQQAVADGLAQSVATHAQHLAASEEAAARNSLRHWEKVERAQAQNNENLAALRADATRQAELLARALEATAEVTRLQDVLNRNLASLAGAKHIEQTVLGLVAAVHLLNARLAEAQAAPSIPLESVRSNAQAA